MRSIFIILSLTLALVACQDRHEHKLLGFIEGQLRYIASETSGYLQQLQVHRGQLIEQHQPLFVLDAMPEQAQLQQAQAQLIAAEQNLANRERGERKTIIEGIEAQLAQARASLLFAEQTLRRQKHLYERGAVGKADHDEAISNYRNANQRVKELEANLAEAKLGQRSQLIREQQAIVDAAKAEVSRLQWLLQQKKRVSPVAARVYDTLFKVGEYVSASQPIVAILAPEDVKLVFYLPERLLSQYKVNDPVSFDCDGCDKRISATISYISPVAEFTPPVIFSQESRDKLVFRVEADLKPQDAWKLNAGQPVDVYLSGV